MYDLHITKGQIFYNMTSPLGRQTTLYLENIFTQCFFFRLNSNSNQVIAISNRRSFFDRHCEGRHSNLPLQCLKPPIQNGYNLKSKGVDWRRPLLAFWHAHFLGLVFNFSVCSFLHYAEKCQFTKEPRQPKSLYVIKRTPLTYKLFFCFFYMI